MLSGSLGGASRFLQGAFRAQVGDEDQSAPSPREGGGVEVPLELLKGLRQALDGEKGAELLEEGFLAKCLVYHRLDVKHAASTATGFLHFRHAAGWPLRIPASKVEAALRTGVHWTLRPRRLEGCVWRGNRSTSDAGPAGCVVMNMAKMDPAVCSVEEYQKMSSFLMEAVTDDPAVQQRGIALVIDFRDLQLSRLSSLINSEDVRRGVLLWRGAFPCRLRRIWLVDPPSALQLLLWGVVRLLSPPVRERVCFARRPSGLRDLQQDLGSLFVLPDCLGGDGPIDWDAEVEVLLEEDRQRRAHEAGEPPVLQAVPEPEREVSYFYAGFHVRMDRSCCISL